MSTFRISAAKEDENERMFFDGKTVEFLGILTSVRKRSTRQKKLMANAVLEDLYGTIELVVFPSVLAQYEEFLTEDSIVLIRGKVDIQENDEPQLIVDAITPYVKRDRQFEGMTLYVKIPQEMAEGMERFKKIVLTCPGMDSIVVLNERTQQKFKTGAAMRV